MAPTQRIALCLPLGPPSARAGCLLLGELERRHSTNPNLALCRGGNQPHQLVVGQTLAAMHLEGRPFEPGLLWCCLLGVLQECPRDSPRVFSCVLAEEHHLSECRGFLVAIRERDQVGEKRVAQRLAAWSFERRRWVKALTPDSSDAGCIGPWFGPVDPGLDVEPSVEVLVKGLGLQIWQHNSECVKQFLSLVAIFQQSGH